MQRICLSCGTKYNFCAKCSPNEPTWRNLFDKEECSVIFRTLSNYNAKIIDREQVKTILAPYNITNFDTFAESIKAQLVDIFAESDSDDITEESDIEDTKKMNKNIKNMK